MDGVPTLQAFDTELRYLETHVYANPFQKIDAMDPVREGGRSKWTDVLDAVQRIKPNTPMKQAIFRTYADRLRVRPADIAAGTAILRDMRATVAAIIELLRMHGKGEPGSSDDTYADAGCWLKPAMTELTLSDIKIMSRAGASDGPVTRIGKDFYARHASRLGLEPLSLEALQSVWSRQNTIGHVARGDGLPVGFFIVETHGSVARVLEWATLGTKDIEQRGLPEAMAMDLMDLTGPKTWDPRRYSRIESDITAVHPPAVPAPEPGSWRDRPALF